MQVLRHFKIQANRRITNKIHSGEFIQETTRSATLSPFLVLIAF